MSLVPSSGSELQPGDHDSAVSNLENLIEAWRKERSKYIIMSKLAAKLCYDRLKDQVQIMPCTSREKDPDSLRVKLETKHADCLDRATFKDVIEKIPDLAAMRIALYYPNQSANVKTLLEQIFDILPKHDTKGIRQTRESGYVADHYWFKLKESDIPPPGDPAHYYPEDTDRVEIQVVSVLVHTWAQVEHQIKYKRKTYTPLSPSEDRILKGLRSIAGSGDIFLEELYDLQAEDTHTFKDQYFLGIWLAENVPEQSRLLKWRNREKDQNLLQIFLEIFKITSPRTLGDVLKHLCPHNKTGAASENLPPKRADARLDEIDNKYAPFKPSTPLYLIDFIILNLRPTEEEEFSQRVKNRPNKLTYQCLTVLNALGWLHQLFDEKNNDSHFLKIFEDYRRRGPNERCNLQWAYRSPSRRYIIQGHAPELVGEDEKIQNLWSWMDKTENEAMKLAFQISRYGVWQKSHKELFAQLTTDKPHVVESREGTDTWPVAAEEGRTIVGFNKQ
jgi:ppGpp synthetase/RelA/SpoT-type nucleotidyltranferase